MTVLDDTRVDGTTDEPSSDASESTVRRRRDRSGVATSDRAGRSRAAQRAIDRRHRRMARGVDGTDARRSVTGVAGQGRSRGIRSRVAAVPFVVPVIGLLVVGLGLSLLLSTKAAQDSYRLGAERAQNQTLMDRRDSLKRSFESGDSAPELSDKASRLGMIPARDPARMIVGANGKARVVGDPEPAQGKPIGTINPSDQPDPVSKIDTNKVDDSRGLPGIAGSDAGGGSTSPTQGNAQNAGGPADSGTTAPSTAAPAPAPAAPSAVPMNPNVLPAAPVGARPNQTNGNPPSGNSR